MADPMADPMAELEAEMKKQREAKQAQARLKAKQDALLDLDRMPPEQDATKDSSSSSVPAASSTAAPGSAPTKVANANPAVYIPPTWHTAGQEPDLAPPPPVDRTEPGSLIDNESISLAMCGCGGPGGGVGTQLFGMAGLHPPSDASFEDYFRGWFEQEHFPAMSEDLKRELVHRAKSKGFFSGISSQVKKWAMANTDARLQSDAWCAYFLQNAPPRFTTIGFMKQASVNLGSQVAPCWISFFGFPEKEGGAKWILPPFCGKSADIVAVLDELDGRGGMTALVAAAA